ncbi:unnamed protein product, partial [Iphiclides podalirius]
MRDIVAASFANAPAPQAPARNPSPPRPPSIPSLETFNSHRRPRRPKLGDKKVYRPVRRHTLSRIDETPPPTRPRSKSLQVSTDLSSMRPMLRSRSNVSADTSRSVPVCDQSVGTFGVSSSPQYAEPKGYDSASSYDPPASMSDLPVLALGPNPYIPYPEYTYYQEAARRLPAKTNNLFLAFMY